MLISSNSCKELNKIITEKGVVYCSGLFHSARWCVVAQNSFGSLMHIIILPNQESAEYCSADLYHLIEGDRVFYLPSTGKNIERSNYKSSLGVQRTAAIERILNFDGKDSIYIVTYPDALEEEIPDLHSIKENRFSIGKGDEINFEQLKEQLFSSGFEKVDFVSAPGQYAIRGSIVDIFSYSLNHPYRISFFGDEVDGINIFDCNTQLSIKKAEKAEIISDIISNANCGTVSVCSKFPEGSIIWFDSSEMYKEKNFFNELQPFRKVFFEIPLDKNGADAVRFGISAQPPFNRNFELLTEDIKSRRECGYKVYLFGEKESQLDRLKSIILQNGGILPEFVSGKALHSGFIDSEDKVCCYTEHEIFGRFQRVRMRRTVEKSEQLTLNDLSAFNIGDYIVHIDYGVGIFGGLVRLKDDQGRYKEVVKLSYKDGDVVFVSVHALNKISRYKPKEGEAPRINKLGSKSWITLKAGAKSKVKDIAKDLIQLYAKRKASKGYAYSADTYLQEELESSFIFEDTPDQETATLSIKKDMEDTCPMDRLVCGDVGFGKTELAIRAAFKAVTDGKQVAVLVPTTILALQHYNTFKSRLQQFPCKVDYISRLRSTKEINTIKKEVAEGKIDIIIGTHKILGVDFGFKDLGLLIIDEEQKFGVSAKEKLRQIKASVDTLTLTATPIPRTLQFSLLGARDLSIINTPPPNRIPVQTEIILFNESEIKSIINYELNRGGQLFFLHNKVEELSSVQVILQRLVPDMRICVAHGQMDAKTLENKMLDFMRGDYDMLLCTTIIENGLDIPNANTILINQAQNFGLSDLHQLRGRVGRSNKRAFCYLIVPPLTSINEDARRRLKAIEEFSDLGSGFNIAMQDLDIRGAGNLLGAEQSGFIMEMGYETYQKILAEAMEELGVETGIYTNGTRSEKFITDCTIETDKQAFIPDSFMDIASEKMRIYKQLDSMRSEKEICLFRSQLEDRFGHLPEEVENLLFVVRIRNLGEKMGFEKIIIKNGLLIMFFISNPMSPYFKSELFLNIAAKSGEGSGFTMKQSEAKLKLLARNVETLEKAWSLIYKLQ